MPDRYLASFDTDHLSHETVDVLVIGTGIAGLSAAITAARAGRDTLMVNKAELVESNTREAKGGIAAVISSDDSLDAHIADTLKAGAGLCDEATVRAVIGAGPRAIKALTAMGCKFDLDESGNPDLGREGGHTGNRIIHAGGDATGVETQRGMLETARAEPHLRAYRNTFVLDLLTEGGADGQCTGAIMMRHNELHVVWASVVVLTSGGVGQLYRESSNPALATADGHAMAIRVGATMRDLEMIQFHPTLLYIAGLDRMLVTEALRGFGAYLRNSRGERFMVGLHELAELAPRDVVSRAINNEMQRTGDAAAFLDVTHCDQVELRRRFPGFAKSCDIAGIDPAQSWVPVRPGPHYMIGGVKADLDGVTSTPGLLAAGEVTSTGLHGANRLASNSLLEGFVCGGRAGARAAQLSSNAGETRAPRIVHERPRGEAPRIDLPDLVASVKGVMWRYLGLEREEHGMLELVRQMEGWLRMLRGREQHYPSEWQLENMLCVGLAMGASALCRKESRGVHYRTDFAQSDDSLAGRHTFFRAARGAWIE